MRPLVVASIVEGYGDVPSIRLLIEKLVSAFDPNASVRVIAPIRVSRSKVVGKEEELKRVVELASLKLAQERPQHGDSWLLVLLDADKDCPAKLGPELEEKIRGIRSDIDSTCVLANVEFETWFIASAESLDHFMCLKPGEKVPEDPEKSRSGKKWVVEHIKVATYSPRVDQPRMTSAIDVALCRSRSKSFDKLCRELELRLKR